MDPVIPGRVFAVHSAVRSARDVASAVPPSSADAESVNCGVHGSVRRGIKNPGKGHSDF